MISHLKDLLKENGALDQFIDNVQAQNQGGYEELLNNVGFDFVHPESDLRSMFDYNTSPEGFDYWLNIQIKWCNKVEELKNDL